MEIDAFVLIGGRSSRFGSDKAFAEIDGESLAERVARIIEQAFPGVSVKFIAADEAQFRGQTERLRRPVLFDSKPGYGTWSGVHTALSNSRAEWTLVIACDLPFISAEFLRRLASEAAGDVDAIAARQSDGRLQPLCSIYRTATVDPLIQHEIEREERPRPLTSVFAHVPIAIVDADAAVLRNVNSPGDLG